MWHSIFILGWTPVPPCPLEPTPGIVRKKEFFDPFDWTFYNEWLVGLVWPSSKSGFVYLECSCDEAAKPPEERDLNMVIVVQVDQKAMQGTKGPDIAWVLDNPLHVCFLEHIAGWSLKCVHCTLCCGAKQLPNRQLMWYGQVVSINRALKRFYFVLSLWPAELVHLCMIGEPTLCRGHCHVQFSFWGTQLEEPRPHSIVGETWDLGEADDLWQSLCDRHSLCGFSALLPCIARISFLFTGVICYSLYSYLAQQDKLLPQEIWARLLGQSKTKPGEAVHLTQSLG